MNTRMFIFAVGLSAILTVTGVSRAQDEQPAPETPATAAAADESKAKSAAQPDNAAVDDRDSSRRSRRSYSRSRERDDSSDASRSSNQAAAPAAAGDSNGFDRYSIVLERNIFSRNRGRSSFEARRAEEAAADSKPTEPVKVDPGASYVLIGISLIGERNYAFFEHVRDRTVTPCKVGDIVAERRITDITLDKLVCEMNGKTVEVPVGRLLTGDAAPNLAGGAPRSSTSSSTPARSTTPAQTPAALSDLLERMRQRREQQGKQ